jgi:hypothetical protein
MIKQRIRQWASRHTTLLECIAILGILIEGIITIIFILYHSVLYIVPLAFYAWLVWLARALLYNMFREKQ